MFKDAQSYPTEEACTLAAEEIFPFMRDLFEAKYGAGRVIMIAQCMQDKAKA